MFGLTKLKDYVEFVDIVKSSFQNVRKDLSDHSLKMYALEEYLGIEFFHGDKSKPHYRKKRVITKKLGRPRKIR